MATKARQQYFADEDSLQKIRREFSIADDIQQKIDSIEEGAQVNVIETVKVNGTALVPDANKAVNVEVPEVIDNLYTVDSDNALSAKQGKLLYDYIQNIASRGRFLSNWNSATGLPMTNPSESPYAYKTGDYYIISNIAALGGTNYRPDGSSYIIGQASTVVETESVDVSDFYFYDGTNWLLLKNSSRSGAVDSALSTTSINPVENRVVTNALNGKQETLIAGSNIQIAADGKTISATDTTYTAGTNVQINNGVISATDTTYTASDFDIKDLADSTSLRSTWSGKQDVLTAGDNIQINGTTISATDTTYNAGENITIQDECTTESDMKGPAPDGFHIPLNTEWQAIYNIWTALGGGSSDGTNFGIALKLPFAGLRGNSNSNVGFQGGYGYYWSSSRYSENNAYYLLFYSSNVSPQRDSIHAYGFSVRCFKNSSVIPTSSWTKLYGTSIETGGIFWSSTDGLISMSSDGTTWITIADKNLGATTVWNNGDTLSEANCGKYYQRGNNYGFPFTGTIANQSTTQVDASSYGPGNYYSSDTFIKRNGSWDSSDNGNLRGGVTQGTSQDCVYNVISATDTTYTAGTGISIDANNVISNTQITQWGNITGTLSNQTDLQNALDSKVNLGVNQVFDSTVVEIGKWEDEGGIQSSGHHITLDPNGELSTYNATVAGYNDATLGSGTLTLIQNTALGGDETATYDHEKIVANDGTNTKTYNFFGNNRIATLNDISGSIGGLVDDTAYGNSWDGVTTIAPSKNAVYDKISTMDTTISGKQDTLVSGTNIKSINNNSLLGSGNLTLNDVKVSSTAPSSPTEGMVWYDSTNDALKTYDGSNWNECGAGGGGIEVFDITQYGINGDWTDIITSCANNDTLTIILDVWEDDDVTQTGWVKWLVTEYDDGATSGTGRISAMALFNLNGVGSAVPYPKSNKLVATFNTTTKYCTGITQYYTEFVPTNSGSTGNVLTKTATGYEWAAPSGGIQNDTTGTTSTVTGIRAGIESEYEDLSTKSASTLYFTF